MLGKLLKYASKFAPRQEIHSTLNDLGIRARKDHDGIVWLESGSLSRAKGGVCILRDLSGYKKAEKTNLFSSNEIPFIIPIRKGFILGLDRKIINVDAPNQLKKVVPATFPLNCAVWSSFNSGSNNKHANASHGEEGEFFLRVSIGSLSKSLAE